MPGEEARRAADPGPNPATGVYDRLRFPLKWTGEREYEPRRHHEGDAGLDLICAEAAAIRPGEFVDVSLGIRIELPRDTWAMITGRSSTLRKRRLLVSQGIIDNGYRGPIFAGIWNLGDTVARVQEGDRLAQLIPFPLVAHRVIPCRVRELSETDRGEAGFGSTGE